MRELRALEIAARAKVVFENGAWQVPSQSSPTTDHTDHTDTKGFVPALFIRVIRVIRRFVSPLWAVAIAARSEPSPLSAAVSTVIILGSMRSSSTSSCGAKDGRPAARCR
jgi:hypothetical protein